MDAGEERIADADERARVGRQALRVHVTAVLFALALTALALILPAGGGEP